MKNRFKPLIAVMLILCPLFPVAQANQNNDTLEIQKNANGKISFARFRQNNGMRMQAATTFLKNILQGKSGDELILTKETTDELGIGHRKYQHYFKGVKVEGSEYVTHGKNGFIEIINGNFERPDITSVSPVLSEQQALKAALNFVNASAYKWEDSLWEGFAKQHTADPKATYYPKGEIVIVKDYLAGGKGLTLAWKFAISSLNPSNEQLVYVDATTGSIVNNISLICNANITCTGQTLYSGMQSFTGDTYPGGIRLREMRGNVSIQTMNLNSTYDHNGSTDFSNSNANWTNGSWPGFNVHRQALDAHWGAEKVFDYWSTVFNRNSIDGNGLRILSYVHAGLGWDNAGWVGGSNSSFMQYGDGSYYFRPLTSLDVCAHEFGHGVCQYTSNLVYQGESGALNEGLSDIWGATIERWVAPAKQTWLIGEEITLNAAALRSLQNPSQFNQPDTYLGANWASTANPSYSNDWGGVHTNSGVINYWYYLLCQGGTGINDIGNNYSVIGIGINNAQRIAYRMESLYLTSSSNYAAARNAGIQAARDLFGANSCAEIAATNAWYAVGVGTPYINIYSISGPTLICSSATYSIPNLPTGASMTWSVQANPYSVLTLAPNTPAPNQLRITNQGFQGVTTTLNAALSGVGCAQTITKLIANDNGGSSQTGNYTQQACTFYNVPHAAQSGTLNGAPVTIHQGCLTTFTLYNMFQRTVTLAPGSLQPMSWSYSSPVNYSDPGILYVQLPLNASGPFRFNINGDGACYSKTLTLFSYTGNQRPLAPGITTVTPATFAILQNPVDNELTVTAITDGKKARVKKDFIFLMKISDAGSGVLRMARKSSKGSAQEKINVSGLSNGYYILEVTSGGQKQSIKFLKE